MCWNVNGDDCQWMVNMIYRKNIFYFFCLLNCLVLSKHLFATERKQGYKFGYTDQFEVSYAENRKINYLSDSDDLISVLQEYERKEDDSYITFEKNGNQFVISKNTGWLETIEITNSECSVSDDKLSVGTLKLKDLYKSYGHNSRHISISVMDGYDKLLISYMSMLALRAIDKLFSKSVDKSRMPLQRWITFTFDYDTQLCEKITITFIQDDDK